jgi:hypothetical protein
LEIAAMLDFKAQSELAEAGATLMRTCAVATAQTMSASALRGLSLWTQVLRSASAGPQQTAAASPALTPAAVAHCADAPAPADAGYASYRSAGGHAVAQVIIGDMPLPRPA